MVQTKCNLLGHISTKGNLTGNLNNSIEYISPELEDLIVTPSVEEQNFKSKKYGYNNVTVNAVKGKVLEITPTIEEQQFNGLYDTINVKAIESEELNIVPSAEEQVKEGLFNKVTVNKIETEEKTATLDFSNANIIKVTPTDGKYLKKVNINKDVNLIPENIAKDIEIFGVVGKAESKGEENAIINEKKYSSIPKLNSNYHILNRTIVKAPSIDTSNWTSGYYLFADCESLKECSLTNTSNMINTDYMFYNCESIETINNLDTSNATTMQDMFRGCTSLKKIPVLNTGKSKNISSIFSGCQSLIEIPTLDTSNAENMSGMFYNCKSITVIPNLDTSNIMSLANMFCNCTLLKTIPALNAEKLSSVYYAFSNTSALENLGGLLNLGKGYTQKKTNYSYYKLDLSYSSKLTYDSLMNIINGLYDLNLTYNVANGGTLYTQQLMIGSTNKSKLTAEEIQIATNKGWTVL